MTKRNKREKKRTVLGHETVFSGHLKFQDELSIKGHFSGSIDGLGNLDIEKDAVCTADFIKIQSLKLKGELEGNVSAIDQVELCSGAKMTGNISAAKLKIADEVNFEGSVTMIRDNAGVDADFFSLDAKDIKTQLGR